MEWNLIETIALASARCVHCHGFGMYRLIKGRERPCDCVYRAVFRACYRRFRDCVRAEKSCTTVCMEWAGQSVGSRSYARRKEEYIADFHIVSRRALDSEEYKVFRYHYLLGADYNLCCRYLKLDTAAFFHITHRIERTLGRVYRELQPYGLFPLDEYFGGSVRKDHFRERMLQFLRSKSSRGERAPLQKIA